MAEEHTAETSDGWLREFPPDRFRRAMIIHRGRKGLVLRARDVHLEREVALATSRDPTTAGPGLLSTLFGAREAGDEPRASALFVADEHERQAGLLREGRLLARIEHSNVMPVLDVGRLPDGVVALVLPFVAGGTLAGRGLSTLPWQAVLDMALQIGRGLAAIHCEGIIHRDLRLDNILLDGEQRPLIAGFGRACTVDEREAVGEVDDDIYAYCTLVYEMFYGCGPFRSANERRAGVVEADRRPGEMSKELHAILARGLAAEPDDRWPDMVSLLTAMERTREPKLARRWPWVAAGFAAAVALGLVAVPVAQADACEEVREEIGSIFDAELQAELRGAYGTTKVGAALERYAARWVEVRARECEAARQDGRTTEASPCAASIRARFDATLQAFRAPHLREGLRWGAVIAQLPDPEHCIDHPRDKSWGRGGLLALAELDVEIEVAITLGELERARFELGRLVELAEDENARYARARALYWTAELRRREGDLDGAARSAERAYAAAIGLDHGAFVAACAMSLTAIAAARGDVEAMDMYGSMARPMFATHAPRRVPELLQTHGLGLVEAAGEDSGELGARGLALLREAVEIREDQAGLLAGRGEPLSVAYESYARGLLAVERPGEALEYLERAEQLHRAEFGHWTWRVHGLLRLKFEVRLGSKHLETATAALWELLAFDAEEQDWSQYASDVLWAADLYVLTGHPLEAQVRLREAQFWVREHGSDDDLERIELAIEELKAN